MTTTRMQRLVLALFVTGLAPTIAAAAPSSEADLVLPDLSSVHFMGVSGRTLLLLGMAICALGMVFGLVMYLALKKLPVHPAMREISELIYGTCKTYLGTQARFILALEAAIIVVLGYYFLVLRHFEPMRVAIIVLFSVIGILGSLAVAWFGIRVNTFANSRSAFASLKGLPYPTYAIPIRAGMSIGMLLISTELLLMLFILVFVPGAYAGPCFIGFAIGESLGAAGLRVAGGIFTKIADIGSDLMKIAFNIKEDDARNPGVIADCAGDNAGDSIGPTADGFETYGVTGVALITFILLAVPAQSAEFVHPVQVQLLVWIFLMRIMMIVTSGASYAINQVLAQRRYARATSMNFEAPLTSLVWITSLVSVGVTYLLSWLTIPDLAGDGTLWWKLASIITCGTLAGAMIPEVVKIFTSTKSGHVREILASSREGGASLNILSGLSAGYFSVYWMVLLIAGLMAAAFAVSTAGLGSIMVAPAVFAFGLVAFGFLGMGPVTIAVDSYGPVTDNAQSVFELSTLAEQPGATESIRKDYGFTPDFGKAKAYLEENDGAGNTFKATAKPVLIGTAVVGATTLIFSIVVVLTQGLTANVDKLSILHPPFLLGLLAGGAVIYWFSGASIQAVATGAHRAVEFIRQNIRLDSGALKASLEDSQRVVAICTRYAQKGTTNIFLVLFFSTLAFACLEPYFFIGYLVSIATVGLYQAIFMANAGGAWDNAKKLVEVDLKEKGTPLHAATVVGDTVGDPFKDTSSVAMNPVIKFTTLFGLLALELAIEMSRAATAVLAAVFMAVSLVFVWRSFYGMRIESAATRRAAESAPAQRAV